MSFLQPLLLFALPLSALPILIHLVNRQRHRTIPWAAMMFLLDARRQRRHMERLRHWLILALRTLVVATLIVALSRPLTGGRWGFVGGRPDTVLLLLDRSVSMEGQNLHRGESKRSTGLRQFASALEALGGRPHVVLIESAGNRPIHVPSPRDLMEHPETGPSSTSADIPGLLETAREYLLANESGVTDIWICSDRRQNDWKPDDGRWSAIRERFERHPGVRFLLLEYPGGTDQNHSIWVESARRRAADAGSELALEVRVTSSSREQGTIPLEFVINGARSLVELELTGNETVDRHVIALDETQPQGWGSVEIPRDGNPRDNHYYFVFAAPPDPHTVVVSDHPTVAEPLILAATAPVDPQVRGTATRVPPNRVAEIDWERASLILWQAPLPEGLTAQQVGHYVGSGRPIIFFPPSEELGPRSPDAWEGDARWGDWHDGADGAPVRTVTWRGDSDLLAHTASGDPLPMSQLETHRYRRIDGGGSVLARLEGGAPLLTRENDVEGPVYFCATLPQASHSSFARDGISFYIMIQRALAAGAATQGLAKQLTIGDAATRAIGNDAAWMSPPPDDWSLVEDRSSHAGVVRRGDEWIALNRPRAEDTSPTLAPEVVDGLFAGLDFRRRSDEIGSTRPIASEAWRAFLAVMALALLLEAWLCLPTRRSAAGSPLEFGKKSP